VARELVGSVLVLRDGDLELTALLVETEAYGGSDDPASHAYRGPTRRCAVMFGPPGYLYVYRIYGLHWCLNVVTGPEGCASAVLLRGAELLDSPGDDSSGGECSTILRGPGNLTRGLGITGGDNGRDCVSGTGRTITFQETRSLEPVVRAARIGITQATERLSRYFLDGHRAVSGPRSSSRT
jgi:DNA-3-methyladenine glycosylase